MSRFRLIRDGVIADTHGLFDQAIPKPFLSCRSFSFESSLSPNHFGLKEPAHKTLFAAGCVCLQLGGGFEYHLVPDRLGGPLRDVAMLSAIRRFLKSDYVRL